MKKYVNPSIAVLRKRVHVLEGLDIYSSSEGVGPQLGNSGEFDGNEPTVVHHNVWDN